MLLPRSELHKAIKRLFSVSSSRTRSSSVSVYPLGKDFLLSLSLILHSNPTSAHCEHCGIFPSHLVFFNRQRSQACATLYVGVDPRLPVLLPETEFPLAGPAPDPLPCTSSSPPPATRINLGATKVSSALDTIVAVSSLLHDQVTSTSSSVLFIIVPLPTVESSC